MKKYYNHIFGLISTILVNFIFDYDLLSSIGIGIFVFWVVSLVNASNKYLPIMELFFCLFAMQFLFGPALSYNGFDEYTNTGYRMKINSDNYFTYVIPLFLIFPLGFKVFFKSDFFKPNITNLNNWLKLNPNIPYVFITIGFISPFLSSFIPKSFTFISYLLESFKFIGIFILILSNRKLKLILLTGIYGGILISSFIGGMFHDLLIWIIVLSLVLSYRYQPKLGMKIIAILLFAFFAIFIQSIKGGLRSNTWDGNENVSVELIENINNRNILENAGFFTMKNIGPLINRVNQGWILASSIDNVPANESHTYGKLTFQYLYSAILPRFLAPSKLKAGEHEIFNKYSGHYLTDATSMGLGLLTDAYIEFGQYGAIIYIFLWGIMYGFILKKFLFYSEKYPILILFSILAFVYPMRPDCETQTVMGHLFKTIMLLAVIFTFFKKSFLLHTKIEKNI